MMWPILAQVTDVVEIGGGVFGAIALAETIKAVANKGRKSDSEKMIEQMHQICTDRDENSRPKCHLPVNFMDVQREIIELNKRIVRLLEQNGGA